MNKISLTKQIIIMQPHYDVFPVTKTDNSVEKLTIQKNKILNWLYSTDRHVSIEKLGSWLENTTEGQYKLVRNNINKDCA